MHNLACHYAKKPDVTSALSWLEIELYYATGAAAMEQVSKPAWRFGLVDFLRPFRFLFLIPAAFLRIYSPGMSDGNFYIGCQPSPSEDEP